MMVIAFKVILLIIIFISFTGAVGEKKDIKLRDNMTYICITSILAFVVSVIWL